MKEPSYIWKAKRISGLLIFSLENPGNSVNAKFQPFGFNLEALWEL